MSNYPVAVKIKLINDLELYYSYRSELQTVATMYYYRGFPQ